MKRILFLLAMLPMMFACSSSGDEPKESSLSLSKNKIEIEYSGEDFVDIQGVESSECNVFVEDDYFARLNIVANTIKVQAEKVGKTNIIVKYKGQEQNCEVSITPIVNYIGIPITAIGESMEYIKENEKSDFVDEGFQRLSYYDGDIPFGANHRYNFEDDKLKYIITYIDISRLSGGSSYSVLKERAGASLDERYTFIQDYTGKYQDILIYSLKNNLYVGARLAGGNGGWYICYAKTLDEVKEILDISSSVSVS